MIKFVLASCHLKNYFFVITYLLEDEQELSLGMLIRCKRIYNFWCSMLVLHQLSNVLSMLWYTFYAFSGTNLLTRCHSASSCFLLFLVSEKLHRKYSRNWTKQIAKFLISRYEDVVRRRAEEVPQGGLTRPRRGQGPPGLHRPRPSAYLFSITGKPWIPEQNSTKISVAAVIANPS